MKLIRLTAVILLALCSTSRPAPALESAGRLMARCEAVLWQQKQDAGLGLELADPNHSGLIGPEWSPLVTDIGHWGDKVASARPEMADALAGYFRRARLKRGDVIAVNASGSFPGFLLATLCAAQTLGLQPVVAYSLGASSYGATDPNFPFPAALEILRQRGHLKDFPLLIFPGGSQDRMEQTLLEAPQPTVKALMNRWPQNAVFPDSLDDGIARRQKFFDSYPVKCFVSIGTPETSTGLGDEILKLPRGLVLPVANYPLAQGLIWTYLRRGIPVVHLLYVRAICQDNRVVWHDQPDAPIAR